MPDSEKQVRQDELLLETRKELNSRTYQEKTSDKFVDKVYTKESSIFKFYAEYKDTIEAAAKGLSSSDNKSIETAMSTFSESAKVVIEGLNALSQIHPFIGVVAVAFKLVISLDLTRRENNQKVLALRVEMQDTICVLFQLRHMKDPEDKGPDGETIKDRLQPLIERIVKSIKECGSVCDAYLKKGFLSRALKSPIYESRLIGWVSVFEEHRIELERCLAVHTARGVDKANEKLDEQQATLRNIENMMSEIFKKLETPREKDISKFIEENGGIKACIEKDDLLTKLITKSGETVSAVAQRSPSKGNDDIVNARKTLQKELAEDVDVIFKRNLAVFEAKMAIQSQQVVDVVVKNGSQIMSVLLSGSYEKIRDSDLQQLWKEMGWKGTVKARSFVLALRDYFTGQFTTEYASSPQITVNAQAPTIKNTEGSEQESDDVQFLAKPTNVNDRWTLDIINIHHMQAILEAIDDDGTGFITIKEANTFAVTRPRGWSLLQWLAFWAQGWHHSVTKYKNKIYLLIQQMHRDLEEVLYDNRRIVDRYLDANHFRTIEQLLRSTNTIPENERLCPELAELTDTYMTKEEERLEQHLKSVGYVIDSPATVSVITGPGRIERYIFPLLYLVLRHHVKIIKVSCHHVLNLEEFNHWTQSLGSLITVVKRRAETLGAIYKQLYLDPKSQLDNMAFGMFCAIWENPNSWKISENSFSQWRDISTETDDIPNGEYDPEFDNLLHYPVEDNFPYLAIDHGIPPSDISREEHTFPSDLTGIWTGHCYNQQIPQKGLITVRIDALDEVGMIVGGKFACWNQKSTVTGSVQGPDKSGIREVKLTLYEEDMDSDSVYQLVGSYDPAKETITGTYVVGSEDTDGAEGCDEDQHENIAQQDGEETEDTKPGSDGSVNADRTEGDEETDDAEKRAQNRTFILTRTPPDLFRFRYPPTTPAQDLAKGRWSFARRAVMYCVQKKRWTKDFFKERIEERKRYCDLETRWSNHQEGIAPSASLNPEEFKALCLFCDTLDPVSCNLYEDLVLYTLKREPYIFNWKCSVCKRNILQPGYMCLQCTGPDLTGVKICPDCIDQPVTVDHFIHHQRHSMLKTFDVLHNYRLSFLVHDSRVVVAKAKKTFKDQETMETFKDQLEAKHGKLAEDESPKSKDKEKKILCACCNLPVSLPCYVCTTCTQEETFICIDCDKKQMPALVTGPAPLHKKSHLTIRVYDNEEENFDIEPDDATIKRLERLEAIVHAKVDDIAARFGSLEKKFDELGLGNLEKKWDERLGLLEKLTQRLLELRTTF